MYRKIYKSPKFTRPFLLSNSSRKSLENRNPLSSRNVSTRSGEFIRNAFWTSLVCSSKNLEFITGPPNIKTNECPAIMKNIDINLMPLMLLRPLSLLLGFVSFFRFSVEQIVQSENLNNFSKTLIREFSKISIIAHPSP